MEIQVIDDFLNRQDFINLKNFFTSDSFPWFIKNVLSNEESETYKTTCDDKYNHQMVHVFYAKGIVRSQYIDVVMPFFDLLGASIPLKAKANLLANTNEIVEHGMHTDTPHNFVHKTAVYYLNNNNGYTLFENGDKVESVANRMAVFDSNIKHTGSTCTDQPYRMVINFNYIKE